MLRDPQRLPDSLTNAHFPWSRSATALFTSAGMHRGLALPRDRPGRSVAANLRFMSWAFAIWRAALNTRAISPDGISWLIRARSFSYSSWVSWSPVNWNPNFWGESGVILRRGAGGGGFPGESWGGTCGSGVPTAFRTECSEAGSGHGGAVSSRA